MRRLVLSEDMKHWTLTSLQPTLIKTGGRLVRHAWRLVFQFPLRRESSMKSGLAEVLVTREMLTGILERIGRLVWHQDSPTQALKIWLTVLRGRPLQIGRPDGNA